MNPEVRPFALLLCSTLLLVLAGCGGLAASAPESKPLVPDVPAIQISADKTSIAAGQSVTLSWTTTNATSVSLTGQATSLKPSGSTTVTPTATSVYTATATGPGGTAAASVTITVQIAVTMVVNPSSIALGEKSTLSWTSEGATSVLIEPSIGATPLSGSVSISPAQNTTYTATAKNAAGESRTASATVTVAAPGSLQSIKHIIFFIQENRTFDHYFGMLAQYRAARGIASDDIDGYDASDMQKYAQLDTLGNAVLPYHQRSVCIENTSPSWNPTHYAYDNGLMDNFVSVKEIPSTIDPQYHRVMGYYDETDIPYYYEAASQFGTSDRFFASVMAGTLANRMYLFAATSAGHIFSEDKAPDGGFPVTTIFELLRDHNITWRYYYQDNSVFLSNFAAWYDPAIRGNVYPIDAANGGWFSTLASSTADQDLPSVIFIEHASQLELDEHPGENMQQGAARVATIVNALLQSPAWQSSVFIISHDDPGGFYDHVPPYSVPAPDNVAPIFTVTPSLPGDFSLSGLRLPLLVISPWVKPHFVSHIPREFTSILKLIEVRFGLPSLTARDAAADDMTEFFDFSRPAWLVPPQLPPQPTTGACDWEREIP